MWRWRQRQAQSLCRSARISGRATDQPFESGVVATGNADEVRLTIDFYLIAMFFVIFDLEAVFIFAWAVAFDELGWRGYVGASVFILVLLLALLYEWRTGVLDWGSLKRARSSAPPQAATD